MKRRCLFLLLLGACGGSPGSPDAAFDGDTDAGIAVPTPPASPTPPECPAGWGDCQPPASPPACEARQMGLPGDSTCRAVGSPCPSEFPEVEGSVLYVRPGESGDGTRMRPFGSLQAALSTATPGTTLALAVGEYPGEVRLPAGVGVQGACADTVLLGGDDASSGAVVFDSTDSFVRNLTIRSEQQTAVLSFAGAEGVLEDVTIEAAFDVAVYLDGGQLMVRRTRIDGPGDHAALVLAGLLEMEEVEVVGASDPQFVLAGGRTTLRRVLSREPRVDEEGYAIGLYIAEGAQVELFDVTVEGAVGEGIVVLDAATVATAERLVVRGTRVADATSALGQGAGTYVARDANLSVRGGWFEDNAWGSMQATGGTIEAEDIWVRESSRGLSAGLDGELTLTRASVHADILGVGAEAGRVTVRDVVVHGDGPAEPHNSALAALSGGELIAQRVEVSEFRGFGVFCLGSRVSVEDASFRDLRALGFRGGPLVVYQAANAIVVDEASIAELRRIRVDRVAGASVTVANSTALLEDLDIVGTRSSGITGGRGLVFFNAMTEAHRVRITDTEGWGVDVYANSTLAMSDLFVSQFLPERFGWGVGVHASEGSQVDLQRAHIEGSAGVGVWAEDADTRITAQRLEVFSTSPRSCVMPACESSPAGIAVGAYSGASISLEGFTVEGVALCGVQVGPGASVDLRGGSVSSAPIGACVHEAGYDLSRLTDDVIFSDNELAIDTVSLPIPEAPEYARSR